MSLVLEGIQKNYVEPDGTPLPILDVERFELAPGEQAVLVGSSGGDGRGGVGGGAGCDGAGAGWEDICLGCLRPFWEALGTSLIFGRGFERCGNSLTGG